MKSTTTTTAELRAEDIYQILSPQKAIDDLKSAKPFAFMAHHPLCDNIPVDEGWKSLQLYVDSVLPALN